MFGGPSVCCLFPSVVLASFPVYLVVKVVVVGVVVVKVVVVGVLLLEVVPLVVLFLLLVVVMLLFLLVVVVLLFVVVLVLVPFGLEVFWWWASRCGWWSGL